MDWRLSIGLTNVILPFLFLMQGKVMDQRDQRFLHYVNVSAGSTNCYIYYLLCFQSEPISMDLSSLSGLLVFSTNCCTRPFVFLERGMFLHYVNVSAGSTNCYVYYLLCFQSEPISMDLSGLSRLSAFSTNCCTRPFVFLERGMFMHVLVVFRRRLSVSLTN